MAEEILIDIDFDKCFKDDSDSIIFTKATSETMMIKRKS